MERNMRFFDPAYGVVTDSYESLLTTIGMMVSDNFHADQRRLAEFARDHGDDMFDRLTILTWYHEVLRKDRLSAAEQQSWEMEKSDLQRGQTPFLTAEEVSSRMKAAGGSCPCCGIVPQFGEQPGRKKGDPDRFQVLACRHLPRKYAPARGFVHQAKSWNGGKRWPFLNGQPVADSKGDPLPNATAMSAAGQ